MQEPIDDIIFHQNATSPSTGLEFNTFRGNLINIEFEITDGTTFSVTFEAKATQYSTKWKPIAVANLATIDLSTTATDSNYIYQCDLTGISAIRIRLSEVSGSISVYGRYVA